MVLFFIFFVNLGKMQDQPYISIPFFGFKVKLCLETVYFELTRFLNLNFLMMRTGAGAILFLCHFLRHPCFTPGLMVDHLLLSSALSHQRLD